MTIRKGVGIDVNKTSMDVCLSMMLGRISLISTRLVAMTTNDSIDMVDVSS